MFRLNKFNIMLNKLNILSRLDRSGTDQTSIKGPVKISYKKLVSYLSKQEDTTSLSLC